MRYLRNHFHTIQILTAISFCLIYLSGDKIATIMIIFVILWSFLIAIGVSSPIFDLGLPLVLNNIINSIYLIGVLLAVIYMLRRGFKKKPANKWSILASLGLFSITFPFLRSENLESILSIVSLGIFIPCNTVVLIICIAQFGKTKDN
jgi:hypothetical protein